ncbi:hypothetical protein FH972_020066 [Carpinus fangiana]|uniref:VQ domain-containing protein n=1 Tax=Carpinus fangiana TaxID=176857 RepID=A0A5N6RVJ8_9ROSI|nr:hypothetical protein FH972_020066 [Carpinus fangiana]
MSSQTRKQLQGPRPALLMVGKSSTKIIKNRPFPAGRSRCSPVIIYLESPKVIHVRPEEFMDTVQRLTGNIQAPCIPSSPPSSCAMVADENMGMGLSSEEEQQKFYSWVRRVWC